MLNSMFERATTCRNDITAGMHSPKVEDKEWEPKKKKQQKKKQKKRIPARHSLSFVCLLYPRLFPSPHHPSTPVCFLLPKFVNLYLNHRRGLHDVVDADVLLPRALPAIVHLHVALQVAF
jgi:hypothetical protein